LWKECNVKQSQSYVTTDSQLANLSLCQAGSEAQGQIYVTIRQLRVCLMWGWVSHLQLVLALASTVVFTVVKLSSTCHLWLHFYILAFYIVRCQESCSLWIHAIYSFKCNSFVYVCTIYTRLGIADHAPTQVACVTTALWSLDFNSTALAPLLSWIETALQLSENITLYAICGIHSSVIGKEGQIMWSKLTALNILWHNGWRPE
jgi:hypothetical protein